MPNNLVEALIKYLCPLKFMVLTIGFMSLLNLSWATDIKGFVRDHHTNESLLGANIIVKGTSDGASVNLSGSYKFAISTPGSYTLVCSFTGYISKEKTIQIDGNTPSITVDFDLEEGSNQLGEIMVLGVMDKTTDEYAQHTEKNADNIINVMSAKTIQLMPDITVANLLQRISGVSIGRNSSGDAQYAIIRGMDQRYNYTLVNGIKIPSPDNKYRYVPMDLFPADLLDRLEVIKTLTPSMEGDAIGGAVNLVMKDAPSHFTVSANVASGISLLSTQRGFTTFDEKIIPAKTPNQEKGRDHTTTPNDFTYKNFDYRKVSAPVNQIYGFSIGDRVTKDKKLGVIVAGSYQNMYRATNGTFFKPNTQPGEGNVPTFDDIYTREYSNHQKRYGVHLKSDYKFNDHHQLKLYSMFVELDESQYRHTIDTSLSIGRSTPGTGNTFILNRSRIQKQSIYNITLQGDHQLSERLKVNWSAVYSIAKNRVPDWSEYQTSQQVGHDIDGNQVVLLSERLYTFKRIWLNNTDKDVAGYLNLIYPLNIKNQRVDLSIGSLYRNKVRDNYYSSYDLTPKSDNGLIPTFNGTISPDQFVFNSSEAAHGNVINPNTYTAKEKIIAGYIQGKTIFNESLEIIGGARVEFTRQSFETIMPLTFEGRKGDISYVDILPSINTKYRLSPNQNLRASYYRSINRAGFFEIIPYNIQGDYYTEIGNPYLKHTVADNVDLRYELFPKLLDQVLVGVFYKNLKNPIEIAYVKDGTSGAALKPGNYGTATNFGLEFSITKYWGSFGLSGNYTYTHSSITTSKLSYNRDSNGQLISTIVNQTRPLQGQSPHIGNLSLLYKNFQNGLDLQISFVYTGKCISQVSPYVNLDYWQQQMLTMDFSAEKKIFNHFSVYCKLQNLLNTPLRVAIQHDNVYQNGAKALPEQTSASKILVQREYYGQTFLGGLRYKI